MVGCTDYKSKLATNEIKLVEIDTTGIAAKQYVGYQELLEISPKIDDPNNNLQYEWLLTDIPNSSNSEFQLISTEKELRYVMNRPISLSSYYLKLTVTDPSNDNLPSLCMWQVYVQSTFTSGLIVTDSKGNTSDFTYIKNQTVSENYDKEERIYRNILETANGNGYPGIFTSLTFSNFGGKTNQVWAITSEGFCSRYDCEDFSENGNSDSEALMPFKPTNFKFLSFFKAYQRFFANSTEGIYSLDR